MNTTTKTIIASAFLTALFTGTSAYAGDRTEGSYDVGYSAVTSSVETQKVNFQIDAIITSYSSISGKK